MIDIQRYREKNKEVQTNTQTDFVCIGKIILLISYV
jgi:hypothetical protein